MKKYDQQEIYNVKYKIHSASLKKAALLKSHFGMGVLP